MTKTNERATRQLSSTAKGEGGSQNILGRAQSRAGVEYFLLVPQSEERKEGLSDVDGSEEVDFDGREKILGRAENRRRKEMSAREM